jgi:hypothetical protein
MMKALLKGDCEMELDSIRFATEEEKSRVLPEFQNRLVYGDSAYGSAIKRPEKMFKSAIADAITHDGRTAYVLPGGSYVAFIISDEEHEAVKAEWENWKPEAKTPAKRWLENTPDGFVLHEGKNSRFVG